MAVRAAIGLCHGYSLARHGTRCSAGCGTPSLDSYPWGKVGLKRSGPRYPPADRQTDRQTERQNNSSISVILRIR